VRQVSSIRGDMVMWKDLAGSHRREVLNVLAVPSFLQVQASSRSEPKAKTGINVLEELTGPVSPH
jgi:hypothetical protein